MHYILVRTLFLVLAASAAAQPAIAADLTRYFESSAGHKPSGDAGMSMSSDRLRVAAAVALRAHDGSTKILPKVTSAVTLGPRVAIETRVNLAEWNGRTNLRDEKFATRLHVQAPAPFVDDLEGRFWRLPDGQTGRLLRLGFYQRLAATRRGGPITIRSKATLETLPATSAAGGAGSQRMGLETEIGGLMSGPAAGRTALRLKIVRHLGIETETARSLAYDRSWTFPRSTQLALNLGLLHATRPTVDVVEPSLGISWRGEF
jgi:hypothetical protein